MKKYFLAGLVFAALLSSCNNNEWDVTSDLSVDGSTGVSTDHCASRRRKARSQTSLPWTTGRKPAITWRRT